jgi:hypothetical protein
MSFAASRRISVLNAAAKVAISYATSTATGSVDLVSAGAIIVLLA